MSELSGRTDMQQALAAYAAGQSSDAGHSVTSDLSIDESLLLHGAGWQPSDLATGVSVQSIPYGAFMIPYGQGAPVKIPSATQAVLDAFRTAAERLRRDCARSEGSGVVGVEVDVEINTHSVKVAFTGTSVRPMQRQAHQPIRPFVTDLSTKDFVLLLRAGWEPLDLAVGASFVGSPLQGFRQFIAQAGQNLELVNLTQALQDAREQAMEHMQSDALAASAGGVVDVSIIDGPLGHSRHIVAFICYGTAVHLVADQHQRIEPELVLPVDDQYGFEAVSLRGR